MATPFSAAILALIAATCWGSGDFFGGMVTRRSDALRSVLYVYSVGLVGLILVALARAEPLSSPADLGWGALSGLFGMLGVGMLFQGFAKGRMGVVAPVSGVLGAGLPVIFTAFTAGLPGMLQFAGFGVALVGIFLLARPERRGGLAPGLLLAVLAGVGFGFFFISLKQVSTTAVFWPLVAGRVAACTVMVVFGRVTRRPLGLPQGIGRLILLSGVLDVSGNVFFLLAVQGGRLDVTTVLSSLFPAVTAIFAWLIIKEHLTRIQVAGVCAALLAIVLITI